MDYEERDKLFDLIYVDVESYDSRTTE